MPQLSPFSVSPSSVHSSPEKLNLLDVQAAVDCHICAELASIDSLIYGSFGFIAYFHGPLCSPCHTAVAGFMFVSRVFNGQAAWCVGLCTPCNVC